MKRLVVYTILLVLTVSILGCGRNKDNAENRKYSDEVFILVLDSENDDPIDDATVVFISGDNIIGKVKSQKDGRTTPVTVEGQEDYRFSIAKDEEKIVQYGVIQAVILKEGYYPGLIFDIRVVEGGGSAIIALERVSPESYLHPYNDNTITVQLPTKYEAGSLVKIVKDRFDDIKDLE